jgi:hypothetical protein
LGCRLEDKTKNSGTEAPREAKPCAGISEIQVDFMFNREGAVWMLHDKPLPALKWVAYDCEKEILSLVTQDGRVADLGLRLAAGRSFYLERAMEVTALLMKNGFVADFAVVPMVTSRMTVN